MFAVISSSFRFHLDVLGLTALAPDISVSLHQGVRAGVGGSWELMRGVLSVVIFTVSVT